MRSADDESARWRCFEAIQAFKRVESSTVRGVNYARVIATLLYDRSLLGVAKGAIYACFFAPRLTAVPSRTGASLLFYSHRSKGRADYDFIVDRLRGVMGQETAVAEMRERLAPWQFFRTLRHLATGLRISRGLQAGAVARVRAAFLAAKFLSLRARIERWCDARTTVVTFADPMPYDNLVAQLGKLHGARTVTAQHGQYRVLDETNVSADAEAYANFISDALLGWGEATRQEFAAAGIDPARVEVVGWLREWPEQQGKGREHGVFGVMLNGGNGAESNPELLAAAERIAAAMDLRYIVRVHPTYGAADYQKLVTTRCLRMEPIPTARYAAEVDFSLGHASSAAIEMLLLGSPTYVLDDGKVAAIFKIPGLCFDSIDSLVDVIRQDRAVDEHSGDRFRSLSRHFNDDADQDARVRAVLFPEDEERGRHQARE